VARRRLARGRGAAHGPRPRPRRAESGWGRRTRSRGQRSRATGKRGARHLCGCARRRPQAQGTSLPGAAATGSGRPGGGRVREEPPARPCRLPACPRGRPPTPVDGHGSESGLTSCARGGGHGLPRARARDIVVQIESFTFSRTQMHWITGYHIL
jgi:hypothetical protein